jgi:hypothetical protein
MRIPTLVPVLATILFLLACSAAMAQGDCKATLNASYSGTDDAKDPDYVDHVFIVTVSTKERCAKVDYKLTVVERYPSGETRTKMKTYNQRVRDGENKGRKVTYRLHRKTRVDDYGFEVVGCTPCSAN